MFEFNACSIGFFCCGFHIRSLDKLLCSLEKVWLLQWMFLDSAIIGELQRSSANVNIFNDIIFRICSGKYTPLEMVISGIQLTNNI